MLLIWKRAARRVIDSRRPLRTTDKVNRAFGHWDKGEFKDCLRELKEAPPGVAAFIIAMGVALDGRDFAASCAAWEYLSSMAPFKAGAAGGGAAAGGGHAASSSGAPSVGCDGWLSEAGCSGSGA